MDVVIPAPQQDQSTPTISATASTIHVLPHTQYSAPPVSPASVLPLPLDQFRAWFAEAAKEVPEPEAMTLCTIAQGSDSIGLGIPSARIVLLKRADPRGFVFFTNYTSAKSECLSNHPFAALVFYWHPLHRSVRVQGKVERLPSGENAEYFNSRPLGSRLGAWASPQSKPVGEGELEGRVEEVKAKFGVTEDTTDAEIPCPEFWGGWRVVPTTIEFWAGRPSRLHDRIVYSRADIESEDWKVERLAP